MHAHGEADGLHSNMYSVQSATDIFAFSTCSKVLSTVVTFPYQVMRTRQQDHHVAYTGMIDCLVRTVKGEGVVGEYFR